jgi:hypothetical protein
MGQGPTPGFSLLAQSRTSRIPDALTKLSERSLGMMTRLRQELAGVLAGYVQGIEHPHRLSALDPTFSHETLHPQQTLNLPPMLLGTREWVVETESPGSNKPDVLLLILRRTWRESTSCPIMTKRRPTHRVPPEPDRSTAWGT